MSRRRDKISMTVNGQMGDSIIDHDIENIDSCARSSKTDGTIVKCVDNSVADKESTSKIISKCNKIKKHLVSKHLSLRKILYQN